MSSMRSRRGTILVGGTLAAVGLAAPAIGQGAGQDPAPVVTERSMVMVAAPGAGFSGRGQSQIAKRNYEKYAAALGLDEVQRQVADTLFQGYADAFSAASEEQSQAMRAVVAQFQESQDRSILQDKMPPISEAFRKQTKQAEAAFFGDLRALLTPEQEARFYKVERLRRREKTLNAGSISGDGVDLTDVVSSLGLSAEAQASLAETLDQYDADLDRALAAREELMESFSGPGPAGGRMDLEEIQANMAKSREVGIGIRDVNQRYGRMLAGMLPEESHAAFNDEVKKRTFPRVYAESHVSKSLKAAAGFGDLTTDQRRMIDEIAATYTREAALANQKWTDEIVKAEESGETGTFGGGGMTVRIASGPDDGSSPLDQARKARRELDDRMSERLNSVLTDDQKARLPAREQSQQTLGPGGPAFFTIDAGN